MNKNGLNSYKTANMETTDQGKLIIIVYDWAIRYCKIAKEKKDQIEARTTAINKAQNAISELMASLDMKAGGEIAGNLYRLYDYMNRRLIDANIKKDYSAIDETLEHLTSLREAWIGAIEKLRKSKTLNNNKTGSFSGIAVVG